MSCIILTNITCCIFANLSQEIWQFTRITVTSLNVSILITCFCSCQLSWEISTSINPSWGLHAEWVACNPHNGFIYVEFCQLNFVGVELEANTINYMLIIFTNRISHVFVILYMKLSLRTEWYQKIPTMQRYYAAMRQVAPTVTAQSYLWHTKNSSGQQIRRTRIVNNKGYKSIYFEH